MKKRIIIVSVITVIALTAVFLLADFNTYTVKTKTVADNAEGIIFSINTFDGKSESEPFISCLGHSWISLDNETDTAVYLMDHEIKSGETLTFSVWALTKHFGVAFNLEPNMIRQYGRYAGRKSIGVRIDESKLRTIESYIKENDKWTFIENCSFWSLHLWNEVVDDEYKLDTQTLLYTPKRLQKALDEFDCTMTDKDFSKAKGCFFYADGIRKELELCQ